jgi:glycosyltransferase involved in cell wall biosynthesis
MISVADAMTEMLVEARVAKPDHFTTIYSGMDVEPFLNAHVHRTSMRTKLGFQEQDIVFGKIARLFHLKGHEYVIEAAKKVVRQVPNAKFLLVGDGLLRHELEDRISKADLSKHFLFAGLVSPSEIPAYISAMDVLVHTSLREGLARALPQSLIAGKPAISFDIDGAREVVISGQTGCLVPALDTQQLAESMVELAQSPAKRDALGREGRRRFTDRFRHQSMTREIRELYSRWMSTT